MPYMFPRHIGTEPDQQFLYGLGCTHIRYPNLKSLREQKYWFQGSGKKLGLTCIWTGFWNMAFFPCRDPHLREIYLVTPGGSKNLLLILGSMEPYAQWQGSINGTSPFVDFLKKECKKIIQFLKKIAPKNDYPDEKKLEYDFIMNLVEGISNTSIRIYKFWELLWNNFKKCSFREQDYHYTATALYILIRGFGHYWSCRPKTRSRIQHNGIF